MTHRASNKFKVQNFSYNGFYGQSLLGMTDYTATFTEWTNDPGIAIFECSDGIKRRIPTFAILGNVETAIPEQKYKNKDKVLLFGQPCKS